MVVRLLPSLGDYVGVLLLLFLSFYFDSNRKRHTLYRRCCSLETLPLNSTYDMVDSRISMLGGGGMMGGPVGGCLGMGPRGGGEQIVPE